MSTSTLKRGSEAEKAILGVRKVRDQLKSDLTIPELTKALNSLNAYAKTELSERYQDEHHEQQVHCLKKSLQAAVTLEFATIPPYLSALWSIKDELNPVAKSIRKVVQEEMLHMALACNMLASLGEVPQITSMLPQYPGSLPGGVHEGLTVTLSGLNKESLSNFLWIERPLHQVPIGNPYEKDNNGDNFDLNKINEDHPGGDTIGEFYEEIRQAFQTYLDNPKNPPLTTENQVSGPLAWTVITDMDSVNWAITLIQEQGEGAPTEAHAGDKMSHYYRFLEIYNEVEYEWCSKTNSLQEVGELPWPDTWPSGPIPAGGYQKEDVSEEVWFYLEKFDKTYTKLLDTLQRAWTVGGQAELVCAYDIMFDLEWSARPLMQIRLPFGGGITYGPCWRLASTDS